jgi:hypothetical protein
LVTLKEIKLGVGNYLGISVSRNSFGDTTLEIRTETAIPTQRLGKDISKAASIRAATTEELLGAAISMQ